MMYEIYVPVVGYSVVYCKADSRREAIDHAMSIAARRTHPDIVECDLEAVREVNRTQLVVPELEVTAEDDY